MGASKTASALNIARKIGILRARDLASFGIKRAYLYRLHKMGVVERVGQRPLCISQCQPDGKPQHR